MNSAFQQAHRAIKRGRVDTFRQLVEDGLDVNASNSSGWSLLMLAALEGNLAGGQLLIDRGACVTATNPASESPLWLAAHKGHERFMRLLLDHGARLPDVVSIEMMRDWLHQASGLPAAKIESTIRVLAELREADS